MAESSFPKATSTTRARAILIATTLFWGMSFPLLRALQLAQQAHAPHIPDRILSCADVTVRFGLAALFLLPLYGRDLARITAKEWSQASGLAVLAVLGLYGQTLGLAWTDASISAFLTQLYTLMVPLIVALRDRRPPTMRVIGACVLVLIGIALLSPRLLSHFTFGAGEIVTIMGAVFFAAQIVWVERPIYAGNRSGLVTLIMFVLVAAISLALYPMLGGTVRMGGELFASATLGGLMLAVVILCTVTTFYVMNRWQRFVSATEAGLIYCLEPVIATTLASFLPGWISRWAGIDYPDETLRWGLLAGGALIIAAAALVATQSAQKSPSS
jgi:drug/metabolite transporter (DMT)-like permease